MKTSALYALFWFIFAVMYLGTAGVFFLLGDNNVAVVYFFCFLVCVTKGGTVH